MNWTLEWSYAAERHDLPKLRLRAAERICGALLTLAKTGGGRIVQTNPDDPNRFRLLVKGAEARLFIDARAHTIYVLHVYRRS